MVQRRLAKRAPPGPTLLRGCGSQDRVEGDRTSLPWGRPRPQRYGDVRGHGRRRRQPQPAGGRRRRRSGAAALLRNPLVHVVVGVSGRGKTTVAAILAARLRWVMEGGDGLHSASDLRNMRTG